MGSNRVERLRYYDGEYLRSNDFTAEQAYHMEMRRRLNQELHLYGVITGLELQADEDSKPPESPLFVITKGMAIDQAGREIVAANPYILRRDEVLNKKGLQTGWNELWLCYREFASGLPTAGYELCNDPDQNTRYRESFEVLLVPIPKVVTPGVSTVDPDGERKGIRLGSVEVENDVTAGLRIKDVRMEMRTYIGLRAQRVLAADNTADTFNVLKKNVTASGDPLPGYLDVKPPVFVRGNFMAQQNAVIGPDFEIIANPPLPAMTDPGNLKVAKNLVLNGDFIANVGGKWFPLKDYIKTLLPEFIPGRLTMQVDVANTPPAVFQKQSSTLAAVSRAEIIVSLAGIKWQNKADLSTWWSTGSTSDFVHVEVSGAASQGGSPNTFDFQLSYTVAPPDAGGTQMVEVHELIVSYLIIFYP